MHDYYLEREKYNEKLYNQVKKAEAEKIKIAHQKMLATKPLIPKKYQMKKMNDKDIRCIEIAELKLESEDLFPSQIKFLEKRIRNIYKKYV